MQRVEEYLEPAAKPPPPPPQPQPQPQPPPTDLHNAPPPTQQQPLQQPTKALRFVTTSGAPHPKRRRIGAACLTCRKRKTACSGERPVCDTCKQNKLDCAGYSSESAAPVHRRSASDVGSRSLSDRDDSRTTERSRKHRRSPDAVPQSKKLLSRTLSAGQSPRAPAEAKIQPVDASRRGDRGQEPLFSGPRNRMPYFRWLGPTAIMPGFKQMVVKVKRGDGDLGRTSTDGGGICSPSLTNMPASEQRGPSIFSNTPSAESDPRASLNLPFYDTSPMPPSELITHLANTFFTHLGCNYPFLQRDRFLRDLEEKQVDAILVDAVCALAARFSKHSLLTQSAPDGEKTSPAEYGHAFAQRAKIALPDTFACPSVAAAQAALLLAYNEFGEQRDSGLWMYLGISIRLAQDLGLHKLEGLRYMGKDGPTPKIVKRQSRSGGYSATLHSYNGTTSRSEAKKLNPGSAREQTPEEQDEMDETKAVEQERIDTFWAIFFLDRVVSSGTGRRSTLRDKDIEISLPPLSRTISKSDWPAPFPALIRIVHLYGHVADLLNSIKEPSDITAVTPKRLAAMESQVTSFYQGLSPRLHFDAVNFQHYMKAGEGTNFVLLHFWFHTLIVLLHQPTLLKTFDRKMLQLFPNSQQLSMSSAKTIADILSYSQLMDAKASLGNPFTTQPIYIAACAFLKETAEQTATSNAQSRASSPSRTRDAQSDSTQSVTSTPGPNLGRASVSTSTILDSASGKSATLGVPDHKSHLAKHTLLATAATQHYQLCYKALQSLEMYWAGTKYILTVLNQKFEGVVDPLLYTVEEGESSMEQPRPEPAFTSPGWRRKFSWGPNDSNFNPDNVQTPFWPPKGFGPVPGSPGGVDPSKAIGWTLTGNMNSSSTNLAWHYASEHKSTAEPRPSPLSPSEFEAATGQAHNIQYPKGLRTASSTAQTIAAPDRLVRQTSSGYGVLGVKVENDSLLLNTPSSYSQQGSIQSPVTAISGTYPPLPPGMYTPTHGPMSITNGNVGQFYGAPAFPGLPGVTLPMNFMPSDMMIESQDVDTSMLSLDMMPWFDSYSTPEMMGLLDPHGHATGGATGSTGSGT